MRACLSCLLLLFVAGCGTLHIRTGSGEFNLSPDETAFAKALAHYAQGLICEQEFGRSSPEAMAEFCLAAELDPGQHELQARAATACLQNDRTEDALRILERACAANPRSIQPWLDRGAVCQLAGQTNAAIAHYQQVLRLDKSNTFAYLSIARLYFQKKMDNEAARILRKGIRYGKNAQALVAYCYAQGRDFISEGEVARSIPCFQLIAQNSPDQRPQFYNLLGELYQGLGFDDEALRNFTLATLEAKPLPDSFVKLALILLKTDPDKAMETLKDADRRVPDNPAILFLLGYIYNRQERYADAINVFDRILPLLPDTEAAKLSPGFYLYYGGSCERAAQYDKAEGIFQQCLTVYPDADAVLNYLAYMWAERGVKLDKAEELVMRALKQQPESGAYIDTLGWVYFKQKRYKEALEKIQKASELVKDDPVVTDHLGDAFLAVEEKDKAVSSWKKSFVLDPTNETVAGKLTAAGVDIHPLRREALKSVPKDKQEAP